MRSSDACTSSRADELAGADERGELVDGAEEEVGHRARHGAVHPCAARNRMSAIMGLCVRHEPRDLPDDLELPLASGAPWWYWLGGAARARLRQHAPRALAPRRRDARHARRPRRGGSCAPSLVDRPMRVPDAVLAEARELREAIDAVRARRSLEGAPPPRARGRRCIDDWLVYAGDAPAAARSTRRRCPVLGERAAGRLAAPRARHDRARRRADARHARPSAPASASARRTPCSARFYDRSPAGRRRWCSMQTCGNAAKARRHRARRREARVSARPARYRWVVLAVGCRRHGASSPRCGRACRRSGRRCATTFGLTLGQVGFVFAASPSAS